jgi:hypothetical protein
MYSTPNTLTPFYPFPSTSFILLLELFEFNVCYVELLREDNCISKSIFLQFYLINIPPSFVRQVVFIRELTLSTLCRMNAATVVFDWQ